MNSELKVNYKIYLLFNKHKQYLCKWTKMKIWVSTKSYIEGVERQWIVIRNFIVVQPPWLSLLLENPSRVSLFLKTYLIDDPLTKSRSNCGASPNRRSLESLWSFTKYFFYTSNLLDLPNWSARLGVIGIEVQLSFSQWEVMEIGLEDSLLDGNWEFDLGNLSTWCAMSLG